MNPSSNLHLPNFFTVLNRSVLLSLLLIPFLSSCDSRDSKDPVEVPELYTPQEEQALLDSVADHPSPRMQFRRVQSPFKSKTEIYGTLFSEVEGFSQERYNELVPLVLEKNIPEIQEAVADGLLTYEELTLFYLKRIYRYELDKETGLQSIISLNPEVLDQARALDSQQGSHHPIYGMPVLLKDNVGTEGMATTAGAVAFLSNWAGDAFITARLKDKGALILGKTNLSEWANFLCDCPNGQSAVGGQTLNPYGRFVHDTGGSSSGSGTATAAGYAVAAVGTETSGSILSPSSSNSLVGMKPTIGLLSRGGIVPISATLDTPGPMTRSLIDNAILLDAMLGYDGMDPASVQVNWEGDWYRPEPGYSLKGKRLGFYRGALETDSLYRQSSEALAAAGAEIVEIELPPVSMDGFLQLLNADMQEAMPDYISNYGGLPDSVGIRNMNDLHAFNLQDSTARIPYGQVRFDGVVADTTSQEDLQALRKSLEDLARLYFKPGFDQGLEAVFSINNGGAHYAAAAKYPALTIPMGYRTDGRPAGLTLFGQQFEEQRLYHLGFEIERILNARKFPEAYR